MISINQGQNYDDAAHLRISPLLTTSMNRSVIPKTEKAEASSRMILEMF